MYSPLIVCISIEGGKKDGVVVVEGDFFLKGKTPHNLHRTNTGFEWPSRWRARPSHTEVCTRHVHRNVSVMLVAMAFGAGRSEGDASQPFCNEFHGGF